MAEIWISEEEITEKALDDLGHFIRLDGEIKRIYFIGAGTDGGDYVEENKIFLRDFLIAQNRYPLYLTFVVYDEQTEEYSALLKKNKIDFTLNELEEKVSYFNILGKYQYHPPCFSVSIHDADSLSLVLEETFWLPAQNEFYSISYCDNLRFHLEKVKEWGRKRDRSIPIFRIDHDTTMITIFHDGAGFFLLSNEEKFSTVERLCSHLPAGTVITQINDTLINNSTNEEK
jgi:hypothetical protein